jgi:hypothetical protein
VTDAQELADDTAAETSTEETPAEVTIPEMDTEPVELLVASWLSELGEQGSVSASDVQDRLLDLWASLPEGAVRTQVERWLTETLERHLYAVDDVQRRLESLATSS